MTKPYIVRFNVEYSIQVEAKDEKEAIEKAEKVDIDAWDQKSTSGYEADECS